jgi:large subunit ribosomal protein L3
MPRAHKPRSGSLQFSHRKRAKRIYPRIGHWLNIQEKKPLAFAGYKAGMTHIIETDTEQHSITKGKKISTAATIIECPPLKPLSLRFYQKTPYGFQVLTQIFSKNLDKELERKIKLPKKEKQKEMPKEYDHIRLLVYTQPKLTGIGKKKPEIFEIPIGSSDLEYAKSLLEKEITLDQVFKPGQYVDVHAVTKGKGFQGVIKRFGVSLKSHKSEKKRRSVGNLGSFIPRRVDWRVPQAGQTGFHTRTEYNKLILMIDSDPKKINQKGGIKHYGEIKNQYLLIKGSVPGPAKRLILITEPIRNKAPVMPPQIEYISQESKQ